MTTESKKAAGLSKKPEKPSISREFARIIEGLKVNQAKIADSLRQRVGAGDWKLTEIDCPLDNGQEKVDLVFSAPDGKKEKYIIIDVSVPHLGAGQKYGLPGKAKLFQKEREVTVARIKKAIILIRKGTESISTQPARIRCPIIEIQLESIVKPEPVAERAKPPVERPAAPAERAGRHPRNAKPEQPVRNTRQEAQPIPAEDKQAPSSTGIAGVSQDLLSALKEAVVHECLSTMHKRCNKYVRKGLWRWIEREIMDPNVHFYLIILSSIYQGKTGEILSWRFKTAESYSSKPEDVIAAIFSRENNLAEEIKKSAERHKKALTKFLICFSQTPPFEYLKSLFLKDFRSNGDGLKARMSVYSTLEQLLERCGFEGEKETRYPLEILDELKIFQGIMTGNYSVLRTDNASKKLKHLVPQVEWSNEDIYSLRNQLSKALNLPPQEFNLNAFLPQAFFHDARHMAETRREAIRLPNSPQGKMPEQPQSATGAAEINSIESAPAGNNAVDANRDRDRGRDLDRARDLDRGRDLNRGRDLDRGRDRGRERQPQPDNRRPRPEVPAERTESPVERPERRPLPARRNEAPEFEAKKAHYTEEPRRPINARTMINSQGNPQSNSQVNGDADQANRDMRPDIDCDEARHRFFENFGGHTDEDTDAIKLALAMVKHESEQAEKTAAKKIEAPVEVDFENDSELDNMHRPPLKATGGGYAPASQMEPPRRSARPNPSDGQPSSNNPDRKRRFSRTPANRNRVRRAPGGGVNR